jgi:hypothetical protein
VNLAKSVKGDDIKKLEDADIDALEQLEDKNRTLRANLAVMRCLEEQIRLLERAILAKSRLRAEFHCLKTGPDAAHRLVKAASLEVDRQFPPEIATRRC